VQWLDKNFIIPKYSFSIPLARRPSEVENKTYGNKHLLKISDYVTKSKQNSILL